VASPPSRRLQGKLYWRQYVLQLLQSKLLWRSNEPIDIVTRALERSGAVRAFITDPMLVALNMEAGSLINLDSASNADFWQGKPVPWLGALRPAGPVK
jgi:hypothetical protein